MSYRLEAEIENGASQLATFQDSSPEANLFPISLADDADIPHKEIIVGGKTEVALGDWILENKQYDSTTGFSGLIFYSADRNEYMVALTGTNGPDSQDWYNNLNYSTTQWIANEQTMRDLLADVLAASPDSSTARITFTGQSLGGALAQFAAYDFVESNPGFNPGSLSIITFNGLGAIGGMRAMRPDFNPQLLSGAETAHYTVYNDIVHRLGEGNFNASNNTYLLDFRAIPGQDRALDIVDAHRIETGFYRGFGWADVNLVARDLGWGSFQSASRLHDINYLNVSEAQALAAAFGQLLNDSDHSPVESLARSIAGIAWGLTLTNFSEIQEATFEFISHVRRASILPDSVLWDVVSVVAPLALKTLAGQGGLSASAFGLVAGIAWDAGEDIASGDAHTWDRLRSLIPTDQIDADVAQSIVSEPNFARSMFKALLGFKITDGTILSGASLDIDPEHVLKDFFTQPDWLQNTLRYFSHQARSSEIGVVGVVAALSSSVTQLARDGGEEAADVVSEVTATVNDLILDVARGIANAFVELSRKATGVAFDLGQAVSSFASVDVFSSAYADEAKNTDHLPDVREALEDALEIVQDAGQLVVIQPGRGPNLFDDTGFDPDGTPIAAGELAEGSLSTFTVYLPYEAGVAGQRVKLNMLGTSMDELSVLAGGQEIELEAGATFTLTIGEGQRETTFSIVAGADLDADEAFTLSATLVDSGGEATHLEHEEATITLLGSAETPPTGGREIRGDWAPKPYDDGAGVYYKFDDLGNIERLPGVPNTTGFSEPDNKLDGSSGSDHIVSGDYEDAAYGFDGDDSITGSELLPTVLSGGAGNDWIEALGYLDHASDFFEFDLLGRTVRLGDDKLYGGAGNDFIYGDAEAAVAALYDNDTTATGLPGDWTSGGSGDDAIFGSAGDDVLMGGIGEDRLTGGAGKDVLLGDDHYYLRPEGNFWTVAHPNYGDATSGYAGFEFGLYPVVNVSTPGSELVFPVTGDPYFTYYKNGGAADILIGGAGDDILIGQAGDDTLYGGEGQDIIAGWEGADLLYGGSGDDLMAGDFGRDEQVNQRGIDGFAGDYRLVRAGVLGSPASFGTPVEQVGDDFLDGGAGNDILFGEGGYDVLLGGDGNDTLWGDATYLPDELHGDDVLDGGAGNDLLSGNSGNDKLHGGDGNDHLSGGAGNDILEGGAGDDSLNGGEGNDVLRGGSGADILAGNAGSDQLHGGAGDDQLSGGDDDDALFGDAGADHLDGGAGNDVLNGGAGEDVIEGGEGDDLIDGGAGIDVVRGGEGNDTYGVGLGYGRDLIEDAQGENRIRFGTGILPEDLGAQLDSSTLAATLEFSAAGDSVSFDAGQFDVAGIEFSNGATWGKAEFVGFMPAVVSQGSSTGEALIGNAKLRNLLDGGGGDDELVGAAYADVLVGGDGDDSLEGNGGADSYVFAPDQEGVDLVQDSGLAALAYLDWYYGARGIEDWAERGEHGGEYRAEGESTGDGASGSFVEYFATFEAASEQHLFATITYVEPLPEIATVLTRNDTQALADLVAAGVLDYDVVEFGSGIALADLDLSIELDGFTGDQHPEQPWYGGGVLSVRWEGSGFDVQIPDVRYGFAGTDLFEDGVPQDEVQSDGSWRGYRLGEGIEAFRFADGSTYSLEEILEQATPVLRYGYPFERGSGQQTIGQEWRSVDFAADIAPADLYAIFGSIDLVFGVVGDSASGVIPRWYANPFAIPQMEFRFADGTVYDNDTVTRLGRTWTGGPFGDHLVGDFFFASALIGLGGDDSLVGNLGNDLLNGGPGRDFLNGRAGNDIYVFGADSEVDVVNEQILGGGQNGSDTVRFAADVAAADLSAERNHDSLTLRVDRTGAELLLPGWFTEAGGTVEIFAFAEGTTWAAADVEALLPPLVATAGDDLLLGFTGADVLDGLDGDDTIHGYAGNDTLRGGPGDDFLGGGAGDDTYVFDPGDGVDEISDRGGSNILRFSDGIDPQAVHVTRDQDSLYLSIADSRDRVGVQSWFFAAQPQLSQVSFADGTTWSAADLENRIALPPASGFDDIFWGTDESDVIDGLAGDDQIYGNAGDDVLDGGDGADYVESGAGNDILRGGAGDDDLEGWPGEGHKLLEGGEGDDYLYYEWRSIAIGGPGDDWIDVYGFNGIVAFNPGDGADTIGVNQSFTLSIGGGVAAADLSLSEDGADIVVSVGDQDSVRLKNEGDGGPGSWPAMILQLFGSAHVYYLGGVINEFYSARAADPSLAEFGLGEVLPRYLIVSSETGALGGVIAHQYATRGTIAHVADAQLRSVLQDPRFGPFFQDTAFEGGNSAPVLENPPGDVATNEDAAFAYTIPADTFADPDAGDELTYAATLDDGSDLPAWLGFDAATRTFSGTPLQADIGTIDVKVTATDGGGLSADDTFALTVANVNDAPVLALPLVDVSFEAERAFSYSVPAGTFSDEDPGDTLALTGATLGGSPLPAWLSFTPETGTFAGNPAAGDIGLSHLQVTATDAAGASIASDFGLVIRAAAGSEVVGSAGDDVIYGGTGDETLTAKGGSDYLYGDIGDDLLRGGGGNDVLQGGDGADVLRGGKGQNVLDGGAGDDLIFGGKGSSLIAGGTGNDTIRTGSGSDVILFNRGDGMDTVLSDRSGDNTLSFGGGIRYSDLSLSRDGKNLIVSAGGEDQITLKNWYAGKHSVLNLQIILDATDEFDAASPDLLHNRKVQTFDFLGMVSAFDSARAESPGLTSWAMTNALLQFHLSGMDDMALGGDLAYWYGRKNGFSGISLAAAQQAIGAAGFGSDAQSLRPFDGLQEGFAKLA
jgi:Ca2+-binding RTX toxin-like protein